MINLKDIICIRKAILHDRGYEIVCPHGKIIWLTKRRTIAGLLLLIHYEICSEEDLVGANPRLKTIKTILKGKYNSSWIKDRYGDANKPFSELWTEEGFACIHAEGLQGNRKYVLRKQDHSSLFNDSAKSIREQLGSSEKEFILQRQNHRCNFCGAVLKKTSEIRPHTFAKDRVSMEFDHKIPIDRGGTNDLSNYQVLCHYCNKCKRQMCFVCREKCSTKCALVNPQTSSIVLATGEDISDRLIK